MYQEQPVAVKVCRKANLNATAMKQFQKEVGILQCCSHSNIVGFIGACTWRVYTLSPFPESQCPSQDDGSLHSSMQLYGAWLDAVSFPGMHCAHAAAGA